MFSRTLQVAAIGLALATSVGSPEAAAAGCKLAMLSEWPVRIENNQLFVEGSVNGQPARVMLDTGSPSTLLDRATATRLNAPRQDVAKRDRVLAAGTESKLEIASLDEFRVVDFKRTPWRMVISGERDLGADVRLGEDFLSLVEFEFDLEHSVVRLFQSENCDGKKLAYWASDGQSVGDVPIAPIIATIRRSCSMSRSTERPSARCSIPARRGRCWTSPQQLAWARRPRRPA